MQISNPAKKPARPRTCIALFKFALFFSFLKVAEGDRYTLNHFPTIENVHRFISATMGHIILAEYLKCEYWAAVK